MKSLLTLLVIIILNVNLFANEGSPLKTYDKAKIVLTDYKRQIVQDISLFETHITYQEPVTGTPKSVPIEDVEMILARTGNRALEGAISGAGLGFLFGWRYGLSLDRSEYERTMLLSTVVSAGIGAIVGYFLDSFDIVYQNKTFDFTYSSAIPTIHSLPILSYTYNF